MLDNCDSIRKGLLYTPTMGEQVDEDIVASFEQKRGINYQHEYMRLYIANVVLTQQLKELLSEKGDLVSKINRLEEAEICKTNYRKLDFEDSKKSDGPSKKQMVQKVQLNTMMKMQKLIKKN
ncbi:unnamed protein product [Paramecium pentaurelia]|uniref:Uncharacterized protein n=1 Tax=Paramecium pentaurelia TaxID=43138 RepID=A0A8S1RTX6_9CILI|nr:unnamed protein product [Paramecium pentaurelia]